MEFDKDKEGSERNGEEIRFYNYIVEGFFLVEQAHKLTGR